MRRSAQSAEFWVHLTTLAISVLLFAAEGQAERAVELYATIMANPFAANSRVFTGVYGPHEARAAASLPEEVAREARERGRERDLVATINELAAEYGVADEEQPA